MILIPFFFFFLSTAQLLDDDIKETIAASPRKNEGPCTDERLRKLMHQGMTDSTTDSKKGVHQAVQEAVGGSWSVICAMCNFSYLAHSTSYCVHSRYQITCLLYRDD